MPEAPNVGLLAPKPPCEALQWPPGVTKATGFPAERCREPRGWGSSAGSPVPSVASRLFLGREGYFGFIFPPCSWCSLAFRLIRTPARP